MTATAPLSALTTIFRPPADCATQWTYSVPSSGETTTAKTQTTIWQNWEENPAIAETCLPSGFYVSYGVYSPGVCPEGYTTNLASTSNAITTAFCCPSGYSHDNDCRSFYSTSTTAVINDRDNPQVTTVGPGVAIKRAITIYNAQSDLSRLPSATNAGSVTNSATTGTASPVGGADATPGLSTGAKAGIGVGVGGGTLMVIFIGIFFFVLPRRKRAKKSKAEPEVAAAADEKPQLDGTEVKSPVTPITPLQELSSRDKRFEVDGEAHRAELPAINHEAVELPADVKLAEKSTEKS